MKKHLSTILLVAVFLLGMCILLYPTVSDYWNSLHQTRAIAGYAEDVAKLDTTQYDALWSDAQAYNRSLLNRETSYALSPDQQAAYDSLLDVSGQGIMGYIEIPEISCSLPIYHGTDESVLQIAVGHIEWSSLPVGGESTHCVLSAHRGLPTATLFTHLDRMEIGDTFRITVLDRTLVYEVDQIKVVTPDDFTDIMITDGMDYCTLLTCTPYGINTHRLLVRGVRIETEQKRTLRVVSEAFIIDRLIVTPVVALPILLVLIVYVFLKPAKKKRPKLDERGEWK